VPGRLLLLINATGLHAGEISVVVGKQWVGFLVDRAPSFPPALRINWQVFESIYSRFQS
jgi:hypothetical protein